jgi:hypothetical protein
MGKMEIHEAAPWRCPSGEHVLGMMIKKGRQLLLYRNAVPLHLSLTPDPSPNGRGENDEIEVMATIEGYVMDVRCSICGEVRTWFPGEERIRRVIERRSNVDTLKR